MPILSMNQMTKNSAEIHCHEALKAASLRSASFLKSLIDERGGGIRVWLSMLVCLAVCFCGCVCLFASVSLFLFSKDYLSSATVMTERRLSTNVLHEL